MQGELKLSIELGNEAMSKDFQVAAALNQTAAKVFQGAREGTIMDDNGNTVGTFELAIVNTKTCWCGAEATVWNTATDATEAHAACDEHVKDGYQSLPEED